MKMVALEVPCWFLRVFFNFVVASVAVHDSIWESLHVYGFVLKFVDDDLRLVSSCRCVQPPRSGPLRCLTFVSMGDVSTREKKEWEGKKRIKTWKWADTRLYTLPCRLVCLSVCPSVRPSVRNVTFFELQIVIALLLLHIRLGLENSRVSGLVLVRVKIWSG